MMPLQLAGHLSQVLICVSVFAATSADNPRIHDNLAHRKGVITIKTAPGAHVSIKQQSHAFWFGTAVAGHMFTGEFTPDKEKYLAVLKGNFNAAVHENAMKWQVTEPRQGEISYREADAALAWCSENGLGMRGHCVYWEVEQFVPDWVKALDDNALRETLKTRAVGVMNHFRGRIAEFDVNNEMLHGDYYAKRLGPSIHVDMFRWCHEANPETILYVNDFSIISGNDLDRYVQQIESLLAQGAPVGGIGLQGHFGTQVDREKVRHVLDTLARFELPITITEFDMKTLDEQAKAQGLKDLYETCFAHPSVRGILMWGFWAPAHWLSTKKWGIEGYTALWDKDWNPTPAALVYRDLVYNQWWTDYEGEADKNGLLRVPVFLGRHNINAMGKDIIVELTQPEASKEMSIQP